MNRITNINWTGGSLGASPISEQLIYDPLTGNVTNLQRESGAFAIDYDDVDQVISSSTSGSLNYNRNWTYDHLGNRLQDSVSGAGSFISNFLTSNGTYSFLADPNGFGETVRETTGSVVKNFGFRADGRFNAFQGGSTSAGYYFDALGRRIAKDITTSSGNFKQSFVHLEQEDRILLGKSGDGTIHTYVDGQGVDDHLARVSSAGAVGFVTDHLGSVLNGEAAGGARAFGLFGEPKGTAPMLSSSATPALYGFTGREFDAESGLGYHRKRSVHSGTGRWISQDPIGLAGDDLNLYRYGLNQPVLKIDLLGTWNFDLTGGKIPASTKKSSAYKKTDEAWSINILISAKFEGVNGRTWSFGFGHVVAVNPEGDNTNRNYFDGYGIGGGLTALETTWAHELGHAKNPFGGGHRDTVPQTIIESTLENEEAGKIYGPQKLDPDISYYESDWW